MRNKKNNPSFSSFSLNLLILFLFCCLANLSAQDKHEWFKRMPLDGKPADNFGKSVSIDGDYAIIGAWTEDEKGPEAGAAYIYYRHQDNENSWGISKKLVAHDGNKFDNFGIEVLIKDNYAFVGAQGNDMFSGAIYVFYKNHGGMNNWGQVKKIVTDDRREGEYLGKQLDYANGFLIAGAYGNSEQGKKSGAAYIFQQHLGGVDNWGQLTKLTAPNGRANDRFGISVTINNEYAIVGADGDNKAGAIYIYKKSNRNLNTTWTYLHQILASDGKSGDRFGHSLAISNNYLLVGADRAEDKTGAVYIFKENLGGTANWGQLQKLTSEEKRSGDAFGRTICMYEDYIIVGSEGHNMSSGAAYIFHETKVGNDNWKILEKYTAFDPEANDNFGCSLAMDGNDLVIGAYRDDDMGNAAGGIYLVTVQKKPTLASKQNRKK